MFGVTGKIIFGRYASLVLEGQRALVCGSHDITGATQRRDQSAIWNLKFQIE
jgi:hypothetical protein